MNPIEFLKQNGYNPNHFRASATPEYATRDCAPEHNASPYIPRIRKNLFVARAPRRHNISNVRRKLLQKWLSDGEKDMTGLFLPYLMLDVFQITENDYLRKVDFGYGERKHYTDLMDAYSTFNSVFFQQFTPEQKSAIVDMMDVFGDYIHNHIEIFRFSIENTIMHLPEDFRHICGALCVCKLMISQARISRDGLYKGHMCSSDVDSHYIKSMEYHITRLMEEYFARCSHVLPEDIWFSDNSAVRQAEENVVKQILEFLKTYSA